MVESCLRVYGRWWKYIALSFCVNTALVYAIHWGKSSEVWVEMPMLQVNLISMSAPACAAESDRKGEKSREKEKFITETDASKKMAVIPLDETSGKEQTAKPRQKEISKSKVADSSAGGEGRQSSTVIHRAKCRHQTPPVYPARARKLGQEGVVILHVKVLADGTTENFRIARSSGYNLLDRAALAAVRKWRFDPPTVNGKRVSGWVRVPIRFALK